MSNYLMRIKENINVLPFNWISISLIDLICNTEPVKKPLKSNMTNRNYNNNKLKLPKKLLKSKEKPHNNNQKDQFMMIFILLLKTLLPNIQNMKYPNNSSNIPNGQISH